MVNPLPGGGTASSQITPERQLQLLRTQTLMVEESMETTRSYLRLLQSQHERLLSLQHDVLTAASSPSKEPEASGSGQVTQPVAEEKEEQ